MGYQTFTEDELTIDGEHQDDIALLIQNKPSDLILYNPRQLSWVKALLDMRLYFYKSYNLRINYFTYRHTLDTLTRRYMDIVFCYHYLLGSCKTDGTLLERIRFRIYWYRYQLELKYWFDASNRKDKSAKHALEYYDRHFGFGYCDMEETGRLEYYH